MISPTIDELKNVVALRDLPDELLQWILDHSEYHEYEDGSMFMKFRGEISSMYFILEGSLNFYMNVNGRQVYYFTFANDVATGGVTGLLPYSRMKSTPGDSYAVGKVRLLMLHKKYFAELERLSPELIQRLIGYMTERARAFATWQLQHEKVNALGKLAASIAHEMNNPASAINRISAELSKRIKLNYELTENILLEGISSEDIKILSQLVDAKENTKASRGRLSAIQRIEKEDIISDWLQQNGVIGKPEVAETFVEAGLTVEDLQVILNASGKEEVVQLIYWLENLLSTQRIIKDLEEASTRISTLVTAIKSHVHMDRTNELQPTNIHNDIENTLTLLGYKLREKNITVKKDFCQNLVDIPAYIGELNQVWTNLIDNAIYAVDNTGELTIETTCDSKNVTVKIIDNGCGIPRENISRIFEPFFTTKNEGLGTGIGLDIVKRIVKNHNGTIKVESEPGRTEFLINIPVIAVPDPLTT